MSRARLLVAAATVALLAPATAHALPDIRPEIFDVSVRVRDVDPDDVAEGCAGGATNRQLIEFSLRTRNDGPNDLVLGNPGCPNCTLNPGAPCTNPLFVCGTAHGHAHFESFAKTDVFDADMNLVAEGRKYGFCLLDLECPNPHYSCSFQGITAGCADIYGAGLPCQYVDITDAALPDGDYTLRVSLDPENAIAEGNETNNTIDVPIHVGPTPPMCTEYPSADVPKTLPDLGTATSTLALPDLGPITSIRVRMAGTHSFVGDVRATLGSPAGTDVVVMDQICDNDDDFDVYLGDDGNGAPVCPPSEPTTLRTPSEPLAPLLGEEAVGAWTLTVRDLAASDSGTLESWSLEVCAICGNGMLDPGEVCDDGNALGGDCCSADCTTAAGNGTACDDHDACTVGGTCSAGACVPDSTLECDPCLVCDKANGCVVPGIIYPCQDSAPRKSTLSIRRDVADPSRDNIVWKWRSQTPVDIDELGAPDVSTDLTLCVYDADGLVLSSTIPAAQMCGGVPCWDISATAAKFSDGAASFDGMKLLRAKEGTIGQILARGAGPGLGAPGLPLSGTARVRLRRNDGTPCWEASFTQYERNSAERFKAKSD